MNGEQALASELLADLTRLGLVSTVADDRPGELRVLDAHLHLFSKLLFAYSPRLVSMPRVGCPVHFCTGLLKPQAGAVAEEQRFLASIPAGGQGDSDAIATLSCLGEMSERLSLCSLGNSDNRVRRYDVEQPEVDFDSLLGLSDSQAKVAFGRLGLAEVSARDVSPKWSRLSDRRIHLRNLQTGEAAQCPSLGVLFRETDEVAGIRLPFASSVGCAVWQHVEGARERALLELVERDAVAQSWYNRLGITSISEEALREILPPDLLLYLASQPRSWGLYHVETDLAVQVVIAVSHDGYGRGCAFGSSAGWDITQACVSALQEMLQSENALSLMDRAYPANGGKTGTPLSPPRQLSYARERVIFEDLPLQDAIAAGEKTIQTTSTFEALLQSCFDRGIGLWEFDATRQDLEIPCIKLLSAELCSWEPRFGKKRLFNGVVERGLRESPATEAEFASRPFPF